MVVGSRSRDGVGQAVLFFADKLDEWKFAGVLDHSEKERSKDVGMSGLFPFVWKTGIVDFTAGDGSCRFGIS